MKNIFSKTTLVFALALVFVFSSFTTVSAFQNTNFSFEPPADFYEVPSEVGTTQWGMINGEIIIVKVHKNSTHLNVEYLDSYDCDEYATADNQKFQEMGKDRMKVNSQYSKKECNGQNVIFGETEASYSESGARVSVYKNTYIFTYLNYIYTVSFSAPDKQTLASMTETISTFKPSDEPFSDNYIIQLYQSASPGVQTGIKYAGIAVGIAIIIWIFSIIKSLFKRPKKIKYSSKPTLNNGGLTDADIMAGQAKPSKAAYPNYPVVVKPVANPQSAPVRPRTPSTQQQNVNNQPPQAGSIPNINDLMNQNKQ